MLADNQFEPIRGNRADLRAQLHITFQDKHVPEIEQYNHTIKRRVCGNYNIMPFDYLPPIMMIEMVYTAMFWRNIFALKGGISKTQSPSEIVLNRKLNFNAHCTLKFGEYMQTHKEHDNTMQSRTIGAIATRTSNGGGGYYFISLSTGRRINHHSWTPMPMLLDVVAQVHHLARWAKAKKNITFTNICDEDLDALYHAIEHDEDDVNLAQATDNLTRVGGEDEDDAHGENLDPEQSNDKDSEEEEDNDSDNHDDDGDDAQET